MLLADGSGFESMSRYNHNVYAEMSARKNFTWSDAVKKRQILFISGTVATDENHRTIHKGDLQAQVRCIYETVQGILDKSGESFDDVIKTTDYITPEAVADYVKTAEIRREFFKGNYPAATGVVVQSLLRPDWLIEIEFTAVLDG